MAGFALKVKTKAGQVVVSGLNSKSTVAELKKSLTTATSIKENCLHVLSGYPPKPINLSPGDATLESVNINSGDTLIVEEKEEVQAPLKVEDNARHHMFDDNMTAGILMKKVVPADNSCLFTSIGFVLSGKVDLTCSSFMRQIISETVSNDKDTYSEAILGKGNPEYSQWILKPESWGGAIELSILSNFYGIEIAVVDTLNAIINRFGEDQSYPHRVFLMFDGIHYDPLYLEPLEGDNIRTIFSTQDENVLEQAQELAREAKSSRQFTDVNKFTLKCLVCGHLMTGQVQAQQHAKETSHMSFGEVA